MKIYNSLSKKMETFKPIRSPHIGIYTCGPTVYNYVSIGNWRTYILGDLVVRTLKYLGFNVDYIMNITDVGHLTGDNLGDADIGEDRLEKASKREGKTAWDIAKFYTDDFLAGFDKLNLTKPKKFCKATDYIKEQIDLVKRIEKKGFAYKISDGIYFDVKKWEKAGGKYGELSTLDKIKEGARVEKNRQKKDPRDFALWKFSKKGEKRHMEWNSPWGVGFPGWHIECSAMSMKHLGEQFDIHIGGEDLRSIHHPNEIVQSEAASGKRPFVRYWLHGAFLVVDGGRMGKSLGNAYTLQDIEKKGFTARHLRYFYLTGHYRKQLNFTWEGLEKAKGGYERLKIKTAKVSRISKVSKVSRVSKVSEVSKAGKGFENKFKEALENDLNMPEALAVVWEMTRSDLADGEKYRLIKKWDEALGLDLIKVIKAEKAVKIGKEIQKMVEKREDMRKKKKWREADDIRNKISDMGYEIEDTDKGTAIKKK